MSWVKGFHKNISNTEYHNDRTYFTSSALKMILKDPYKFQQTYIDGNPEEETRNTSALDLGSYVHSLILEPHLIQEEYAIYEGVQRRGLRWEAFYAANKNKTIITKNQQKEAEKLLQYFTETEVLLDNNSVVNIKDFFTTKGNTEETLCGILEGIDCKVRFDYRDDTRIIDIKTTFESLLNKETLEAVCENYDYDLSAAMYLDMAEQALGIDMEYFFCYISKQGGGVRLAKASEKFLERGRQKYKRALKRIKQCQSDSKFFNSEIIILE